MFSPGTGTGRGRKRPNRTLLNKTETLTGSLSPVTPLTENRIIPDRPSTGTPAPWAPRLSVLARSPTVNRSDKVAGSDPTKPVFVGEFPDVVRDEQANLLQRRSSAGDSYVSGGMDRQSSLSWIISGNKVFIWSYLSPAVSKNCIVLRIPLDSTEIGHTGENLSHGSSWLVCLVNWGDANERKSKLGKHFMSAGIVICNKRTRAIFYWPDIYSVKEAEPVCSILSSDDGDVITSPADGKVTPNRQQEHRRGSGFSNAFNSLIISPISKEERQCVALACSSGGELWQFQCCSKFVTRKMICSSFSSDSNAGHFAGIRGYPRSLVWRYSYLSSKENAREFFLLTDHEIQCYTIGLSSGFAVSKLWSHEIIGSDGDQGIKKDLAGQKRIWPLDAQVDDRGKEITVLVATFCKDRASSSSYTQYSLLTMQYKSRRSVSSEGEEPGSNHSQVLEKKCPLQVIIPKARVEEEDFLFSMRLQIGGKPSGSAVILSGDGTATVSHYCGNATKLYQFDLPYDAGKVLDASVLPSAEDNEEGAWVVLTEKAGIWAIPQKAIVLGGVEPPERSLSRKGSSNGGSMQEERRNLTFGSVVPRRASSEALDSGDRRKAAITGIALRTAQDEESEALLGHLFHDFLLYGQVDGSFEKLKNANAFVREGEMNVFVRMSKSIVDTLAKHWTTTRGAEIVAMAVISTQLAEKQQKHQKFLQFLALSKCHGELSSRQRSAMLSIMEHGEKLAGMIKLRELHNLVSQSRADGEGTQHTSSEIETSGALWDLIQLVGERARRNTVLLMDRDNAEVFYSKVSELEEIFYCVEKQLDYFISIEQPYEVQIPRAFELSNACVLIIQTALHYRNEHHLWYPSPEGMTPWHCQPVVRNGLWSIASFLLQLSSDAAGVNMSAKSKIYTQLEVLTEVLLEAYTGAITAKVERGEEEKGLLEEFWNRRDNLLDSLYVLTKLVNSRQQDSNEGSGEQCQENFRNPYTNLLAIAKQHEGYRTLWNICCDLNDPVLLRSLMKESMGPKGGFSYFVFKQLYENKQYSKLLRLGEEFPEKLSVFVEQYPDLLWLHEVFLHQFSSASDTLHSLALSETQDYVSEAEEGAEPDHRDLNLTLVQRKHFLNLSKIATLAGEETAMETKLARLEADLKILKLQEEVTELLDNEAKQNIGNKLLLPEDLIGLCLKSSNADLTLQAFDVFAWTSSSFRRSHKSLLEECWKNAADQDDWGSLYQASMAEGWTDEETLRVLKDTLLFQASSRCYGPEAVTFEKGFEEVLPLRQDNTEPLDLKDSGSLEAILMQHKNYPDAGKLMLTAVMLGSVQGGLGEEGPSPVE